MTRNLHNKRAEERKEKEERKMCYNSSFMINYVLHKWTACPEVLVRFLNLVVRPVLHTDQRVITLDSIGCADGIRPGLWKILKLSYEDGESHLHTP